MSAGRTERLLRLDALRVAAVLGVVVLHAAGSIGVRPRDPFFRGWWAWILADAAVLWCVPAFVMLSGAVLLGNEGGEDWRQFYRKRARRLLIPLAGWTAIYFVLLSPEVFVSCEHFRPPVQ